MYVCTYTYIYIYIHIYHIYFYMTSFCPRFLAGLVQGSFVFGRASLPSRPSAYGSWDARQEFICPQNKGQILGAQLFQQLSGLYSGARLPALDALYQLRSSSKLCNLQFLLLLDLQSLRLRVCLG